MRCTFNPLAGRHDGEEEIREQFKNADRKTCLVFAHAEWLWSFAVTDLTIERKRSYTKRMLSINEQEDRSIKEVFPHGFGRAGMYHKKRLQGKKLWQQEDSGELSKMEKKR